MNHIPIIYENEKIIIIYKQAGISVQGGAGIAHPLDKELPKQLGHEIFLVHRLDKDTAGLMIVAKSHEAAAAWTKLVASRAVQKEYDAVCIGKFAKKSGTLTDNVRERGVLKKAVTQYAVTAEYERICAGEVVVLSLVHATLQTGRMHQIRIHFAKQNCPIAGDDKHGSFAQNKLLKKECGIKHLLLCASSLTFAPDGHVRTFAIELPEYMHMDSYSFRRIG
ncbi:MAG: RluA family pseudouridine synthase [Treponema sp.]|nr:RluA family pseudouridine synthase [Treponema sp.]